MQRSGVDDLVSGAPNAREFRYEGRLIVHRQGPPDGHGFIHAVTVEIGADLAFELVDEGVDVFGRLGPVKVAVPVRNIAIERCDYGVDQSCHRQPRDGSVRPPDR